MASLWDQIGKDRERRDRARRRVEAWAKREHLADRRRAERVATVSQAEQSRRDRADGLAEAQRRNAALADQVADLCGVLTAVVNLLPPTLTTMRSKVPDVEQDGLEPKFDEPRPEWTAFAPPEPGLFGRRSYKRAVDLAQEAFDRAYRDYEQRRRNDEEALRCAHEAHQLSVRRAHEQRWETISTGVAQLDPVSVSELAGAILAALAPLSALLEGGRAVYQTEPRELVIEVDLPDTDVVPTEREWAYVHVRRAVEPRPRTAKDAAQLYADMISSVVLGVVHTCFRGIDREVMDALTVNGHVDTTDPATGRPAHPCLITVTVSRESFDGLDLGHVKLNPARCLKVLGFEQSPHPYDLEHIEPFVDFDLAKYRIVTAAEALVKVDHREDLLAMNPYDFEKLVKQLFIAMGYETWRTTSSRDDGVDAVATRSDPIFPVECVIQAKRFRNRVPPKEVQALIGAMAEAGTATHGVLVTTSWLSDRSRQRARDQRIVTIERNELAFLIEKHLHRKVVISNHPPQP